MNIEQIKKDWKQHCKEYGFKPDIYEEELEDNGWCWVLSIEGCYIGCNYPVIKLSNPIYLDGFEVFGEIDLDDTKKLKCYITFYEKLMEARDENK